MLMSFFECTCNKAIRCFFTLTLFLPIHSMRLWCPLWPLMRTPCHHAPLTCRTVDLQHSCGSGPPASARPCCPPSPCFERCHCDWAQPQTQSKHHPRCHLSPARVQHRHAHPYPLPHWEEQSGWSETKKHGQTERTDRDTKRRERETDRRETDAQTYRAKEQKINQCSWSNWGLRHVVSHKGPVYNNNSEEPLLLSQ